MGNLKTLRVEGNNISDTGMVAFANAIKPTPENPMGSLRSLEILDLGDNQIGDAGMIEFSRQISIGSSARPVPRTPQSAHQWPHFPHGESH